MRKKAPPTDRTVQSPYLITNDPWRRAGALHKRAVEMFSIDGDLLADARDAQAQEGKRSLAGSMLATESGQPRADCEAAVQLALETLEGKL